MASTLPAVDHRMGSNPLFEFTTTYPRVGQQPRSKDQGRGMAARMKDDPGLARGCGHSSRINKISVGSAMGKSVDRSARANSALAQPRKLLIGRARAAHGVQENLLQRHPFASPHGTVAGAGRCLRLYASAQLLERALRN
jgi:hypothetical protein